MEDSGIRTDICGTSELQPRVSSTAAVRKAVTLTHRFAVRVKLARVRERPWARSVDLVRAQDEDRELWHIVSLELRHALRHRGRLAVPVCDNIMIIMCNSRQVPVLSKRILQNLIDRVHTDIAHSPPRSVEASMATPALSREMLALTTVSW